MGKVKGTRFEDFLGEPILIIEILNTCPFIFLMNRGSRAPMTQEYIPSLFALSSSSPNHSFNLAPSIPYSGGVPN